MLFAGERSEQPTQAHFVTTGGLGLGTEPSPDEARLKLVAHCTATIADDGFASAVKGGNAMHRWIGPRVR